MIQVEIAPADGTAGDFQDDIAVFDDLGLVGFDWIRMIRLIMKEMECGV